jgi:NTP pyrophosphatase (non-canonical NTP hydrolase)
MNLNDYQEKASAFIMESIKDEPMYFVLGLAGESGEVANRFKKVLRDDKGQLNNEAAADLAHELGDCLWYIAMIASEVLKLDLATIAKWNLVKLSNRHGKATAETETNMVGDSVVESLLRLYDEQAKDPNQIEIYKGLRATVAKFVQKGMAK